MRKLICICIIALAAVAVVAPTASAAGLSKRHSEVTLQVVSISTYDVSLWGGTVLALKGRCGKNRVVTVFNGGQKIGSTKAKPVGGIAYEWELKKDGYDGNQSDPYIAKIKASAKCKGDTARLGY